MITCSGCSRCFGGQFGFDRHIDKRHGGRCRSDRELRTRGLTVRDDGVWVRSASWYRQTRLIPGLPGNPKWGRSILRDRPRRVERGLPRVKSRPDQPGLAEGLGEGGGA